MMEPGLPVRDRRPQKQALDGLLQIRGRVKGSCRSSDWTITKTKTVTRCGRCRHEPGWYGWLAGWLARWLKWENFGSAPELGARRDGSFNCGPCSPARSRLRKGASTTAQAPPFSIHQRMAIRHSGSTFHGEHDYALPQSVLQYGGSFSDT